ncbi:RNA polymerase factor sigma-32 [Salinarimonas soli]|uniref:RNA polymerase factor sigma-32 n=1 Tax=Salinarimonas soli TaxID=1638099 RepID=A0A5B2VES7_9HYPH|nr:RNA polymerase factor sigma-32 [Salinarimonas soli]KAA2237108.1 RNA polymerase factor sigma-32 [Salinarimonas soli]
MGDSAGIRRRFVRAAMDAPFLEREEERGLAVRWRETHDQSALHRLAASHMRLVIAIAARYRHYGLPMGDLVQEGHVGLLEAAARFEPEREVRFSTYATWWIRASIQDYILRNWSIVRGGTSSAQKALFFNLRRLRAKLTRGGEERVADRFYGEIAEAIGVSREDVAVMDARLSGPDASLNAPVLEGEAGSSAERMDFLVCTAPLPDETVSESIDGDRRLRWLRGALSVLNERELRIVRERRLSEEQATLESLGDKLGISKERVRQIENRALEKLRRALVERHPQAATA